MDNTNFDVPNLIKSNQYFKVLSYIKNYENTLQKLFSSSKDSELIKNPTVFSWKIKPNDELFPNLKEINLDIFGLNKTDLGENIVLTGPFIRSYFMSNVENDKVRKEIYAYRIGNNAWDTIVDLKDFKDKKTEYVLQTENINIYLVKKKYKSLAHVILQHDNLKRCGWWNGDFYVSSMFLIDIQKHISLIENNFKDPILNILYDPLDVYIQESKEKVKFLSDPVKLIEMIDHDNLLKISNKDLVKLYGNKTCLELCLDKYVNENNPILINELKRMIVHLSFLRYKRPPYLYAKVLKIDKLIPELYKLLKNVHCEYQILENVNDTDICIESLDDINNVIFDNIIKTNLSEHFCNYVAYTKKKITKDLLQLIIKYNAKNLAKHLISRKLIDQNFAYYLILMMEDIELVKEFTTGFNLEIALNYFIDIIENGRSRSFYFLYEMDQSIINTQFDNNQNILHKIKPVGNFIDLIKIIMKLKPDLINCTDIQKSTPLIYYAKNCPELLQYFIDYEFDETLCDINGDTLLHCLCKRDHVDILRMFIKRCPELIDMPNKKSETPIIIAGISGQEDMFYTLKGFGANTNSKDSYGNTVYHYICSNSICLGLTIENKQNYFGLTPKDYCKISFSFFNFIDEN